MKPPKKYALLSSALWLVLSTSLPENAAAAGVRDLTKEGLPNIQSRAALIIDLSTDAVLFERDADTVRPIASVSKLVGALVIQSDCKLAPDGLHTMSVANRDAAKGGDKSKLITGWSYSHNDLLHAALMRSDNRALPALGEACGMDPAALGQRMTEYVRRLGLTKTSFAEPNGLSESNVSTAREVMVFLKQALREPKLVEIMTTSDYVITAHRDGKQRSITVRNTDRLLTRTSFSILGGKTGYTDPARYCLAIAARTVTGREVGMVFLGAEGRHTRFADFTRVVRWIDPNQQPEPRPTVPPAAPAHPVASTNRPAPPPVPDKEPRSLDSATTIILSTSPGAAGRPTPVPAMPLPSGVEEQAPAPVPPAPSEVEPINSSSVGSHSKRKAKNDGPATYKW